ncbi:MAG: LysM peptidoglycan-binding domain-containing protein [Pontiella sp.]
MKIGSAVLGVAVLCAFALTQGCVTTESQGSGRGAGARHKGPWKHEHKGKAESTMVAQSDPYTYDAGQDATSIYDPVIIESSSSSVAPYAGAAAAAAGSTEVYIVQKGDVLSQLAVDYDTTTASLVEINGLSNPDVLYVGQELRVPAGRSGSSKFTTTKSSGSIKKGGTYTIKKGDTLSEIAIAAGVGIDDLRSLNGIKGDQINAGDSLDIPSYGKVPSSTKKASTKKKSSSTPVEPAPAAAAPAPAPMAATAAIVEPQVETTAMSVDMIEDKVLYPGESLDDVARQYGVSKSEIMRLNNISDETQVKEGMRLRIPVAE